MKPRPSSTLQWVIAALSVLLGAVAATTDPALLEIEKANNASLLWGPYRPNLYFGVRPRIPKSLMMGLMWAAVDQYEGVQENFRHTCEQHQISGYGWEAYDPRRGGVQTIHDSGNKLDIETSYIKVPGGEHGGNWGVRIKGTPRPEDGGHDDLKSTVVFYIALEGLGSLEAEVREDEGTEIKGQTSDLGEFTVLARDQGAGERNRHPESSHLAADDKNLKKDIVKSVTVPLDVIWQSKGVAFASMKQQVDGYLQTYGNENLPPSHLFYTIEDEAGSGNLHLIQKVFEGPFDFDVLFNSASAPKPITSEDLTTEINSVRKSFSERFTKVLGPQGPFTGKRYQEFSESLFSNLVGGIGYFYGDSKVDRSYAQEYEEENEGFWEETAEARSRVEPEMEGPSELFTSIPSRPFFPRGFLWDEGFHLIPVLDFDADLTLEIIKSWFALMDENGWIAREQILGPEARSKVPAEFQVQYPHYANPPTLFLVLSSYIEKLRSSAPASEGGAQESLNPDSLGSTYLTNYAAAKTYLKELYPLLKRQYQWFRKTQAGDMRTYERPTTSHSREGYRWRGRTPQHILPSGLDDYPRAQPPHPGELHVDLISWVGMMANSLKDIADFLGETEDAEDYATHLKNIKANIEDIHWDEKAGCWCDATVDEYEETGRVCHKGYISLFPFMTGVVDRDSKHLGKVLDLIANEEELWSPHGIRSLSLSDEFYGSGENYWRSPVWMNMNYMIVQRLLDLAQLKGPHQAQAKKIYSSLRKNLVDTVYDSWLETGFAWEQYNPETGQGQRTQHFTGWTSMVVKIMNMPDLEGKGGKVRDEL